MLRSHSEAAWAIDLFMDGTLKLSSLKRAFIEKALDLIDRLT